MGMKNLMGLSLVALSALSATNVNASNMCGVVNGFEYYQDEGPYGPTAFIRVKFADGSVVDKVNQPTESSLAVATAGNLKVCFSGDRSDGRSISSMSK